MATITVLAGAKYQSAAFTVNLSGSNVNAGMKIGIETGIIKPDGSSLKLGGSDQFYAVDNAPPGVYTVPAGALTITINRGLLKTGLAYGESAYIVLYAAGVHAMPSGKSFGDIYGAETGLNVIEEIVTVVIGPITLT